MPDALPCFVVYLLLSRDLSRPICNSVRLGEKTSPAGILAANYFDFDEILRPCERADAHSRAGRTEVFSKVLVACRDDNRQVRRGRYSKSSILMMSSACMPASTTMLCRLRIARSACTSIPSPTVPSTSTPVCPAVYNQVAPAGTNLAVTESGSCTA